MTRRGAHRGEAWQVLFCGENPHAPNTASSGLRARPSDDIKSPDGLGGKSVAMILCDCLQIFKRDVNFHKAVKRFDNSFYLAA